MFLLKAFFLLATIAGLAGLVYSFFAQPGYSERSDERKLRDFKERKLKFRFYGTAIAVGGGLLFFCSLAFKTVPSGHYAVASLFGNVQEQPFGEGLHFPVNPLYDWTEYDARQKTLLLEDVGVPSRDQLTTKLDVSIQFRIVGAHAPKILQNTGTGVQVVDVHLIPKARSLLREQGKSIERAEDFFSEQVQERLQTDLGIELSSFMESRGVEVQAVLIRDIVLPPFILDAIESKKEREQSVERQRAELERQKLEAEQQVVLATAAKEAAIEEAIKIETLAQAQAKAIRLVNDASARNPAYIQLEALKALQKISEDPAAKMYFMNGDSPNPLPLMHMGEGVVTGGSK